MGGVAGLTSSIWIGTGELRFSPETWTGFWRLGRGFGDRQFWWIAPIASSVGRLGPGRRVRSCHFQVPARPHITHQTTSHSVRAVVLYFLFHSESETSVRKHAHPTHIICESSNDIGNEA